MHVSRAYSHDGCFYIIPPHATLAKYVLIAKMDSILPHRHYFCACVRLLARNDPFNSSPQGGGARRGPPPPSGREVGKSPFSRKNQPECRRKYSMLYKPAGRPLARWLFYPTVFLTHGPCQWPVVKRKHERVRVCGVRGWSSKRMASIFRHPLINKLNHQHTCSVVAACGVDSVTPPT